MTFNYTEAPAVRCRKGEIVQYEGEHWTMSGRDKHGKLVFLTRGKAKRTITGKTRVGRLNGARSGC